MVYIWIMNSQSHDRHAVWTKRRLQGLSRASLGAPVVASSTADGGGGCKAYFQLHFFLGDKCSIPPPSNAWATGPLSQSHYWWHIPLSARDPTLPDSIPLSSFRSHSWMSIPLFQVYIYHPTTTLFVYTLAMGGRGWREWWWCVRGGHRRVDCAAGRSQWGWKA